MVIDFNLCLCCGHQAKRRQIITNRWGPLYPDLCDSCWDDVQKRFNLRDPSSMTDAYKEIKTKEEFFKANYDIIGFDPIIREKPKDDEEEPELNWKVKLFQILDTFDDLAEDLYDPFWPDHGMTERERQLILIEYDKYHNRA